MTFSRHLTSNGDEWGCCYMITCPDITIWFHFGQYQLVFLCLDCYLIKLWPGRMHFGREKEKKKGLSPMEVFLVGVGRNEAKGQFKWFVQQPSRACHQVQWSNIYSWIHQSNYQPPTSPQAHKLHDWYILEDSVLWLMVSPETTLHLL